MDHRNRASRARLHDSLRGFDLPTEYKNAPPMVTWRRAGCHHRLLRLYLTPGGWMMLSDRGRVSLPEWIERTGVTEYTTDDYREGRVFAFNGRKIAGHERLLPLDTAEWPRGSFEIGCRDGMGRCSLDDLTRDVALVRATHRAVHREVSPIV